MNLLDVVGREGVPRPWAEGDKIPWDDPGFSRRMLREHLSQSHDAASRRFEVIDGQVEWIHDHLLKGRPGRILDLACGPGLYTSRLARLGHCCVGIDFSPASVAYAQAQAGHRQLQATYIRQDIRKADYGAGVDLVMLIFGEINVFRPADARTILEKAYRALAPGGWLLLEPQTFEAVRRLGAQPTSWYAAESGLFSDGPHLCLQENFWDEEARVAIERFYILDAATGQVTRHSASTQAYTGEEYGSLLAECGFPEVQIGLPAEWSTGSARSDLTLTVSSKSSPFCE